MDRAIHNRESGPGTPILNPLECVFTKHDFTKSFRMNVYVMYGGWGAWILDVRSWRLNNAGGE